MERLQPRQQTESSGMENAARVLLKLAFWSFVVVMGLLGLFFTVSWTTPQEMKVDESLQGAYYAQEFGTGEVARLQGTYQHYTLGNEPDSFQGEFTLGGNTYAVNLEFPLGQAYSFCHEEGKNGFSLLMSRDRKVLLFQDGEDKLWIAPADTATLADIQKLLEENPHWENLIDWE